MGLSRFAAGLGCLAAVVGAGRRRSVAFGAHAASSSPGGPRLPRARPIDLAWFIFSCASRGHKLGVRIGGFSWGLRGLCCWSGTTWAADSVVPHAAAGAAGAQALRGQRKGAPSLAASVLHFGLVYLFFLFFFSMSVQTKIQRGFLNWRFVRIWEGDYLFDGFAWIRCFMTVSERTVDVLFWREWKLVCAIFAATRVAWCFAMASFLAALGLGAHTCVAGGGTFVASALLASPSVHAQVSCSCICL